MIKKKSNSEMKKNNFAFDLKGLTLEEVEQKIKNKQNNLFISNINKSILNILFTNIFTFFNFLLLVVTCFILYVKHYEQLFFLFINILNICINIFQEIKAKRTLDKISLLKPNYTCVIREGLMTQILIDDVVTEDILFLELGSQIVADAKVKKGVIEVDESILTGESNLILKKEGDILYSGSYVVSGNACAEVIFVGAQTYIAKLTQEAKRYKKIETPLIRSLSSFVLSLFFLLIPMTFILYCVPRPINFTDEKFILGLCGFILSMVPFGLFLLTSTTLFVSFIKLAKKNVYIKELFGIEMLAQIDILCLDKTGTITSGNMEVKNVLKYPDFYLLSEDLIFDIINVFPINNPTQKALYQKFCSAEILSKKKISYQILKKQPFSSINKYSAVEIEKSGTFILGAPEFILKKQFHQIQEDFQKLVNLGYRVLLLAQTDTSLDDINYDTEYKIISLISLEEQIKEDALNTINYFIQNGINIKIISGDNPKTIAHIAQRLNIIDSSEQSISLMDLNSEELNQISSKYNVFGRANPQQKKNIINNLKKQNNKVAMIGDGVNDISAFKESDVSVAMASGNEASKNTANLILLDSQFSSLIQVVIEGRRVVNNLQKISILFLTKTILSFLLALVTIFFNLIHCKNGPRIPFPLQPLQFNLIDTFFIGIPSFFLALEINNKKITESFFRSVLRKASPYSILMTLFYVLLLFFYNNIGSHNVSILFNIFISFVFFYLLILISRPFNKWKKILVVSLFLSFLFIYLLIFEKDINNLMNLMK